HMCVNLVSMLVAVSMLASNHWLGVRPQRDVVESILTFGLKSYVGSLSHLANERADQALISLILAPVYLGLYAIAATLTAPVVLIGTSLAIIALPFVGAAQSERDSRM